MCSVLPGPDNQSFVLRARLDTRYPSIQRELLWSGFRQRLTSLWPHLHFECFKAGVREHK